MVESELIARFLIAPARAATAGDRFWFLFTDAPDRPPLLICPLDTDTTMPNLMAMVSAASLPLGARVIQGRGELAGDGALELTNHQLLPGMLARLAEWVCANSADVSNLDRLVGTRFIRRSRGHRSRIEAVMDEPALWGRLRRPVVAGTMGVTLNRLAEMRTDQRAWYWLTDRGPGGRPYLHLSLESEDPDCKEFRESVAALRQRSDDSGLSAAGVLVRTRFLFTPTSSEPIPHWGPLLQSILESWGATFPALLGLAAVPLTYVRNGRVDGFEASRCTLPDHPGSLMRELAVLQHTRGEQKAWFWLTAADADGHPRLCMADDRAVLKQAVRGIPCDGPALRGSIQITRGEAIELHTRSACSDAPAALSRWIKQNQIGWPIVRLLRRAVFVEHSEDGQIIARHLVETPRSSRAAE
ncbi:MAG: hypothetical protein ACI8RZ_002522 [Myxococcota bacterium]